MASPTPSSPPGSSSHPRSVGPSAGTLATDAARRLTPVRRLLALFRPDRADVLAVVAFSLLTGVLLAVQPVVVQALVNFVAFGASIPSLAILVLLLFSGLGLAAVVIVIQNWVVEVVQRRMFLRLVGDLAERLPRLSWRVRDHYYEPELVNRFFDVVTIQKTGATLLLDGVANLLSIVVGLTIVAFYHPFLLAFDVGLILAIFLVFALPMARGMKTSIAESAAKYEVQGWLEEIAKNSLTLKTSGTSAYTHAKSAEVARSYIEARRTHYRVVLGQIAAALALHVLASSVLLGLGGWLVVIGELSLGQLVAAELLIVLVVQSVAKMGQLTEKFYDLIAAVDKVGKLLDLEVEDGHQPHGTSPRARGPAGLEVRSLSLPSDVQGRFTGILDFRVAPGSLVGIQGPHGAGKSLLLQLLYRLRPAGSGTIVFDGIHATDWDLHSYREQVALVSEPEVLEASIFDNVAIGRPNVDIVAVQEALACVGLLEEIQALPEGLNTSLRFRGGPLSAGQRARMVLARAIAGRPRLLLIDQVLDDISPSSREALLSRLRARCSEWTIVLASSHPEALTTCDAIIDLDQQTQSTPSEESSS